MGALRRQRILLNLYLIMCLLLGNIVESFVMQQPSHHPKRSQNESLAALASSADKDGCDDTATSSLSQSSSSMSSTCPFERNFPRYKIPLQSISEKKRSNPLAKFVPSILRDLQAQIQKQSLVAKYPNCQVAMAFNLDGAHAMAFLWKRTEDLLQKVNGLADGSATVVIGLDNVRLAQNFCDILEWSLQHVPDLVGIPMTVQYLPDDKAVRISCRGFTTTTTTPRTLRDTAMYNPTDIATHTQAWVKRVLVKMGICPFTKSVQKSGQGLAEVGVPVGKIVYPTCTGTNALMLMADTWEAICKFLDAGAEEQSSILLAAPAYDDDFATWAGPIFCILETCVVAAQAESDVGVVCFHPSYATPDGTTWPGFGHMHSVPRLMQWVQNEQQEQQPAENALQGSHGFSRQDIAAGGAWQRRTPHATINVLRADQLARAEGRRNSASLYPRNIRALLAVGNERLQADLERDRGLSKYS